MGNAQNGLDLTDLKRYPGYLLARARWQAFRAFDAHIGKVLDLRRVEFSILLTLQGNRDATAVQLAQALAVAAPNMTGILRRLEERKLIARVRAESDRRSQHIALTASGHKLVAQAVAAGKGMDKPWLGKLSRAEQGMLLELLAKLGEPSVPLPASELD
jgi:DNA-binding MarR family transcriptional regulator